MNGDRKQARRYHWLSEGLDRVSSTTRTPRSTGRGQGEIVNLADRRAEASRRRSSICFRRSDPTGSRASCGKLEGARAPSRAEPAQPLLPHLVMPAHHDVRAERRVTRRLHGNLAAAADRGPADFPELLLVPGVGRAHRARARDGGGGGARRAVPLQRSGALFARAWRQGRASVPGAAQGLRRDDPGAEVGRPAGKARPRRRARGAQAAGRAGARARAPCRRSVRRRR